MMIQCKVFGTSLEVFMDQQAMKYPEFKIYYIVSEEDIIEGELTENISLVTGNNMRKYR
jgi:hypothetical protein